MAPSAIDELMLPVSGTLNQPVSVPNMALLGETKTKIISRSVYIMYIIYIMFYIIYITYVMLTLLKLFIDIFFENDNNLKMNISRPNASGH